MTTPLLSTKLYIPPERPNLIPRLHLIAKLAAGLNGKITLISAQAGFGKTTLLSQFITASERPATWISLDEADNDPNRFMTYLVAAVQKIDPGLGDGVLERLQLAQPTDIEIVLTNLINQIVERSRQFILVLDDYHVITEPEIQNILLFIIENQPPQLHLVVGSRSDPPWPLARFRVRGELIELRSQDLRFTPQETAAFFKDVIGVDLKPSDVTALIVRTEGWIAGLQMAALSMYGRDDVPRFIQSFTGSNRFVLDYLMEEVLDQQSAEIQDFLLKTSILRRLSGPLCDAVVGGKYSQDILAEVEQRNLFLIPLDDQRRWYRYHHLFADLLKGHLHLTRSDDLPELNLKASIWHQENDLLPDAINHALAAKDIGQIASLTEAMGVYEMDRRNVNTLFAWLEKLPVDAFQKYPWLLVTRAWTLINLGKFEDAEDHLDEIESILVAGKLQDELAVRIRGHVAAIGSYLAEIGENVPFAYRQAEKALELLSDVDLKLRSFVAIRLANCSVWLGNFDKAILAFKEAGETSKLLGDGHLAITAFSEMAVIQAHTGRMNQAVESIQELNRYAQDLIQRDGRQFPALGILYRHMGLMLRERNELIEARSYAEKAVKLCQRWGEKENLFYGLLALARIQFAGGEYEQVDHNFKKIMVLAGQISPQYEITAQNWLLHFQLLRGKSDKAENWAQDLELSVDDVISYERSFEYQNFARILFSKGENTQAIKVLWNLIHVVDQEGAKMQTLRLKMLAAKILHQLNQLDKVAVELGGLLPMARAEGYIRSILDEADGVDDLLRFAILKGIEVEFAGKMLRALDNEPTMRISKMLPTGIMVDPLSKRELEILRLLTTAINPKEIADDLAVSLNTLRTHIKHIYTKLGVHSRHEAITRAKELKLL